MLKTLSALVFCTLVFPTHEQSSVPFSPCPNVFMYETPGSEPNRWYGTVNLSTDSTLHSVWLNVVLDSKADILGNWVGDVSTTDNIDFKIENTKMKVHPGPAVAIRFFVQYNPLNKPPRLQEIRLNGREICNAKNPLPAVDRPESDSQSKPNRPVTGSTTQHNQETSVSRPGIKPGDGVVTKPVSGRPNQSHNNGPVYVPSSSSVESNPNPYNIGDGQVSSQNVGTQTGGRPNQGFGHTTARPHRTTTQRDDNDYGGNSNDYFGGGQPTFIVSESPNSNNNNNNNYPSQGSQSDQGVCGTVVRNNPNPLVVNGKPTQEGQWPWQIALYQTQTVDNKYICGGTLVSRSHIITAAHCVTRKGSNRVVNQNTLTVYLGKHNLRTSVEGVQIRFVQEIRVHPQYNASSYARDLSMLFLREEVRITDWVRPACLWPENELGLDNVIGKKGAVVGWGFDDTGVATEELTLVEMPVVDQETCIRSYSEFFVRFTSEFTYCAGYKDGALDEYSGIRKSTSVCNGDSGGGMVFKKRNIWYLRGLVSLSVARQNEYRCDPTHYVVFTDLAKFLGWIRDNINGGNSAYSRNARQ